jgi:hypothetical protein
MYFSVVDLQGPPHLQQQPSLQTGGMVGQTEESSEPYNFSTSPSKLAYTQQYPTYEEKAQKRKKKRESYMEAISMGSLCNEPKPVFLETSEPIDL